jgi:tRNA (pseudouridine54-N1)-methyltransferase
MREFVVVGHRAPVEPEFSLDDLPGAGRLDVLCRCLTSALLRSHGVREDSRVHLVLGDEFTLTVDGATVRRLNPDERSTAALVRTALEARERAVGAVPAEPHPGVELRRRGVAGTVETVADRNTLVELHEEGTPVADWDPFDDGAEPSVAFVLSDHEDFTDAERARLADAADHRLRLGPTALHADQAIVVAHHFLDTGGYERV